MMIDLHVLVTLLFIDCRPMAEFYDITLLFLFKSEVRNPELVIHQLGA